MGLAGNETGKEGRNQRKKHRGTQTDERTKETVKYMALAIKWEEQELWKRKE